MLVMLVAATAYGARDTSRLQIMTEVTGNASGIGFVAVCFWVGLAIGGLLGGAVVDRFGSRGVLTSGVAMQAVGSFAMAVLIVRNVQSVGPYGAVTLFDGIFTGACIPALAAMQAVMVPSDARGSAEIISILRLGVGAVAGILLATASDRPLRTVIAIAMVMAVVAILVWVITRPGSPSGAAPPTRRRPGSRAARPVTRIARTGEQDRVLQTLRELPVLRRVVVADLVLCLVIPTQYANLLLADRREAGLVAPTLIGGVAGVVVGRLVLTYTGSRGRVRESLLISDAAFVILAFFGVGLLATGVAFASPWIPAAVLFFGGALNAYTQGLLAALVQQQVPDDVRGRLTGALAAARSLIIAAGAALLTAVILPWSAVGATAFVAVAGLVALLAVRGFRGITATAA